MIEETFLNYKNYRWMWIHLVLLGVLIGIYYWDDPIGGRSGGTWVGYSYGSLAAAAILYLLWFGLRKRSHYSRLTTLKSCLAVHVWLGISLIVIVPLHSGFQFGSNVHTFAYILMLGVIGSGILGTRLYLTLPRTVKSQSGGGTIKSLTEEMRMHSQEIEWVAKERSDNFLLLIEKVDFTFIPSIRDALLKRTPPESDNKEIASLLSSLDEAERTEALGVIKHAQRKRELLLQIQEEIRAMALFRTWLYVHVPLSYGLVMAVAVHVFSVLVMR